MGGDQLTGGGQPGVGRLEAINRGSEAGAQLADLDLPRLLSDQLLLADDPDSGLPSELLGRLTPLLEPSDVQRLSLSNPPLQLRGATAALERQRSMKRARHLLDAWSSQRLETLERCIARLLDDSQAPPAEAAAETLDMETRIEAMFAELNSDALRFQDLYYNERKHIEHLDSQRRASFEDVVAESQDAQPA